MNINKYLLSILCLLLFNSCLEKREWNIETIDTADHLIAAISLALDFNNNAHISYIHGSPKKLKYATNASVEWENETIDNIGNTNTYTSLTLDSDDNVHIIYVKEEHTGNTTVDSIKYANNVSGEWIIETIDSVEGYMNDPSLALDAFDIAHISYGRYGALEGSINYATKVSDTWIIEELDFWDGGSSSWTSLALDSYDNVHIFFKHPNSNGVKYATNSSGSWTIEEWDRPFGAFLFDSNDKMHICSSSLSCPACFGVISYHSNVSGKWVSNTVDGGESAICSYIALDSNGKVYISYIKSAPPGPFGFYTLFVANNVFGFWLKDRLESSSRGNSLTIDSNNNVHIAYEYYDLSDRDYVFELRYAQKIDN